MIENITRLFTESLLAPKQKDVRWLEQRRKKICASEIAGYIGKNPYKSVKNAIESKIKNIHFSNPATRHGERYETIARQLHEIKEDVICIELNFLVDPVHKYIGASPDGICFKVKHGTKTEWALSRIKKFMSGCCNVSVLIDTGNKKTISAVPFENSINSLISHVNPDDIIDVFLVEIKCPSKTDVKKKYVPKYYVYQMYCQLAVCQVNSCNFCNNRIIELSEEEYKKRNKKNDDAYISGLLCYNGKKVTYPTLSKYYSIENRWGPDAKKIESSGVFLYRDPNYIEKMHEECLEKINCAFVKYWYVEKQVIIPINYDKKKWRKTIEKLKNVMSKNPEFHSLIMGKGLK